MTMNKVNDSWTIATVPTPRQQTIEAVGDLNGKAMEALRMVGSLKAEGLTFDAAWLIRRKVQTALESLDKVGRVLSDLENADNY